MKWEYRVVIEDNNYHLRRAMNRLGKKGWEAFDVDCMTYPCGDNVFFAYLKRRKRRR